MNERSVITSLIYKTRQHSRDFLFLVIITLWLTNIALAQTNPRFNVNLQVDYSAADQTIALLEGEPVSTKALAELRANRIAASTTGLITDRAGVTEHLENYLDSLKYHQIIRDDVYRLESARRDVVPIKDLLYEIIRRNFSRKVVATVEQIFPQDADIDVIIPVYIVALGHDNVDAYVRRIVWHGDVPEFVDEGEGELTIVVNLTHAARFGKETDERFVNLLGVVAHEVFHAAFGAYKDRSPLWKNYRSTHQRPFDRLLDLTQNEGIAYYLSLDQLGHGYVPPDWSGKTRDVFSAFNKNSLELLSANIKPRRVAELLRTANLSGFWESYGAMTGMFIAREIDLRLGRAALIETITLGPYDFFKKYLSLSIQDGNLPAPSDEFINAITNR
jgi:hypothetical protein